LSLKAAMDEADLRARLRGEFHTIESTTKRKKRAGASSSKPPSGSPAPESTATEDEEDERETMFSTMLDEMPTTEVSGTGTTVIVRNLPLPKHTSSSSKSPKSLLSETALKIDKYAVVLYELISGSSRAVRVKCDIRWDGGRISEWRMDEVGCWDRDQADWFVSTIALHALAYPLPDEEKIGFVAGGGPQSGVSVSSMRYFPIPYRNLWSELEEERKREEAVQNRKVWKCLLEVAEARDVVGEVRLTFS
jgi:ATP-dependent RNA helicase DHX29